MVHAASKILFFIFQPSSLAVMAWQQGLILARANQERSALRFIAVGFAWIVLAGFLPLGNALVLPWRTSPHANRRCHKAMSPASSSWRF